MSEPAETIPAPSPPPPSTVTPAPVPVVTPPPAPAPVVAPEPVVVPPPAKVEAPKETPKEAPKDTPAQVPASKPDVAPIDAPKDAAKETPKESTVEAPKATPTPAATPAPVATPTATTLVQAAETLVVEAATGIGKTILKSGAKDLKAIEKGVASEAIHVGTDEDVTFMDKVEDAAQIVANEVVKGAQNVVTAIEAHPELIVEGGLAIAVGALSIVNPGLIAGEIAILGKMATDSATATITQIAQDEGTKVLQAISKDVTEDAKKVQDAAEALDKKVEEVKTNLETKVDEAKTEVKSEVKAVLESVAVPAGSAPAPGMTTGQEKALIDAIAAEVSPAQTEDKVVTLEIDQGAPTDGSPDTHHPITLEITVGADGQVKGVAQTVVDQPEADEPSKTEQTPNAQETAKVEDTLKVEEVAKTETPEVDEKKVNAAPDVVEKDIDSIDAKEVDTTGLTPVLEIPATVVEAPKSEDAKVEAPASHEEKPMSLNITIGSDGKIQTVTQVVAPEKDASSKEAEASKPDETKAEVTDVVKAKEDSVEATKSKEFELASVQDVEVKSEEKEVPAPVVPEPTLAKSVASKASAPSQIAESKPDIVSEADHVTGEAATKEIPLADLQPKESRLAEIHETTAPVSSELPSSDKEAEPLPADMPESAIVVTEASEPTLVILEALAEMETPASKSAEDAPVVSADEIANSSESETVLKSETIVRDMVPESTSDVEEGKVEPEVTPEPVIEDVTPTVQAEAGEKTPEPAASDKPTATIEEEIEPMLSKEILDQAPESEAVNSKAEIESATEPEKEKTISATENETTEESSKSTRVVPEALAEIESKEPEAHKENTPTTEEDATEPVETKENIHTTIEPENEPEIVMNVAEAIAEPAEPEVSEPSTETVKIESEPEEAIQNPDSSVKLETTVEPTEALPTASKLDTAAPTEGVITNGATSEENVEEQGDLPEPIVEAVSPITVKDLKPETPAQLVEEISDVTLVAQDEPVEIKEDSVTPAEEEPIKESVVEDDSKTPKPVENETSESESQVHEPEILAKVDGTIVDTELRVTETEEEKAEIAIPEVEESIQDTKKDDDVEPAVLEDTGITTDKELEVEVLEEIDQGDADAAAPKTSPEKDAVHEETGRESGGAVTEEVSQEVAKSAEIDVSAVVNTAAAKADYREIVEAHERATDTVQEESEDVNKEAEPESVDMEETKVDDSAEFEVDDEKIVRNGSNNKEIEEPSQHAKESTADPPKVEEAVSEAHEEPLSAKDKLEEEVIEGQEDKVDSPDVNRHVVDKLIEAAIPISLVATAGAILHEAMPEPLKSHPIEKSAEVAKITEDKPVLEQLGLTHGEEPKPEADKPTISESREVEAVPVQTASKQPQQILNQEPAKEDESDVVTEPAVQQEQATEQESVVGQESAVKQEKDIKESVLESVVKSTPAEEPVQAEKSEIKEASEIPALEKNVIIEPIVKSTKTVPAQTDTVVAECTEESLSIAAQEPKEAIPEPVVTKEVESSPKGVVVPVTTIHVSSTPVPDLMEAETPLANEPSVEQPQVEQTKVENPQDDSNIAEAKVGEPESHKPEPKIVEVVESPTSKIAKAAEIAVPSAILTAVASVSLAKSASIPDLIPAAPSSPTLAITQESLDHLHTSTSSLTRSSNSTLSTPSYKETEIDHMAEVLEQLTKTISAQTANSSKSIDSTVEPPAAEVRPSPKVSEPVEPVVKPVAVEVVKPDVVEAAKPVSAEIITPEIAQIIAAVVKAPEAVTTEASKSTAENVPESSTTEVPEPKVSTPRPITVTVKSVETIKHAESAAKAVEEPPKPVETSTPAEPAEATPAKTVETVAPAEPTPATTTTPVAAKRSSVWRYLWPFGGSSSPKTAEPSKIETPKASSESASEVSAIPQMAA